MPPLQPVIFTHAFIWKSPFKAGKSAWYSLMLIYIHVPSAGNVCSRCSMQHIVQIYKPGLLYLKYCIQYSTSVNDYYFFSLFFSFCIFQLDIKLINVFVIVSGLISVILDLDIQDIGIYQIIFFYFKTTFRYMIIAIQTLL